MKSSAIYWVFAIVALVLFAAIYWIETNINPNPKTPPIPTPPAINGFLDIQLATTKEVRKDDVDDAISSSPSKPWNLAQKEALVSANQPALATLRNALAKPCMCPPIRSRYDTFPYLAPMRALARLLRLQSQVDVAHGDWNGALQSDMEAVQLGEKIPNGNSLIHRLVGIACQAIGRRDIWSEIDHLSATDSRQAALDIQTMQENQYPLAGTYVQEKRIGEITLMELFHQRGWSGTIFAIGTEMGSGGAPNLIDGFKCLATSKRAVLKNYTIFMDESIRRAKMPYAEAAKLPCIPQPPDLISQTSLPILSTFKDAENDAENSLLATALALHAYHLDHGRYPDTLAQLVPTYLKSVPSDPFAISAALKYRLTGATYILYSVGPDGIDDGGKPIYAATEDGYTLTGIYRYRVDQDSKGDIVAGTNII